MKQHWGGIKVKVRKTGTGVCFLKEGLAYRFLQFLCPSNLYICVLFSPVILMNLLGEDRADQVVKGQGIVQEDELEVRPSHVSTFLIDEQVDVVLIKQHSSADAWLQLQSVLQEKKKDPQWACSICHLSMEDCMDDATWIQCDRCLDWCHLSCTAHETKPKSSLWFCTPCRKAEQ